jgi:enoyl-CoA hydratase/carnithine racemase
MEALRYGRIAAGENVLAFEAMLSALCLKTEDAKEAALAFNEKRKPNFKGK